MTANIINRTKIAQNLRKTVTLGVAERLNNQQTQPGLDVILIGNNPASQSYVGHKERACHEVGIQSTVHRLPESIIEAELLQLIQTLNQNPTTHGILLQLPLPEHWESLPDRLLEHLLRFCQRENALPSCCL